MVNEITREQVVRHFQRMVENGERYQKELVAKMTTVAETLYVIRWLADVPRELAIAEMAAQTLDYLNGAGAALPIEEALAVIRKEFAHQRAGWYPENSTSPWSNAVHNQRYEALRSFTEKLEWLNG